MNGIKTAMREWIDTHEISGAALLVRKNGELICREYVGWADIENHTPIQEDSIFRLMSMTKPITSAAVLKLAEAGEIRLDDPVSGYIPAFANPRVVQDARYVFNPGMTQQRFLELAAAFRLDQVHTVPADREITIRDLLSHTSGLEQGLVGLLAGMKDHRVNENLEMEAEKYAAYPLDFHPGTATSYSPLAGFDLLLRICEIVTGQNAADYLKKTIFEPLGMKDAAFFLTDAQKSRLVRLYKKENERLRDVTDTSDDMDGMLHRGEKMISGSGGLYATAADYERFAQMLCNEGSLDGVRVLNPKTVCLMRTEAPAIHLEPEPGMVWGLGVRIRQQPERVGNPCTPGTYGWSGAFGTHFFISPADHLDAVWCTNRSDAGGSGFSVSKEIERLIFGILR